VLCHRRSWKLNLHTTETATGDPASGLMVEIWRTIRGYILWSYERGTIQYDVMVTLILLFVLLSPRWINFNDKPIERNPHPIGVIVTPDAGGGFIYQIEGVAVSAKDDEAIHDQLLAIIEPISGGVSISKVEPIRDKAGRILSYRVWAQKE
jgi:hypothetical protein